MKIYIKVQKGDAIVEKGEIITIGSMTSNGVYLLTGRDKGHLIEIGRYKDEVRAKEIMGEILQRVVEPKTREVERGAIYIDLEGIE